jgi:hypothetical protein
VTALDDRGRAPSHILSELGFGVRCTDDLRFLQPVRQAPAMAPARTGDGLCQIEVHDRGSHDRLAAIATARLFPSQGR